MSDKPRKPEKPDQKSIPFYVNVTFEEAAEGQAPPVSVYAFDSKGVLLASAPVEGKEGRVQLNLPAESANRTVRLVVGHGPMGDEAPTFAELTRRGGFEKRFRLDPQNARVDIALQRPVWELLLYCPCVVRGRLVKRVTLPNGTLKEFPICNARVTICEVDRWPIIIWRLPDDLLHRLRDDLIDVIVNPPFPWPPEPEPDPFFPPMPGPGPDPAPFFLGGLSRRVSRVARKTARASFAAGTTLRGGDFFTGRMMSAQDFTDDQRYVLQSLSAASGLELRRSLADLSEFVRPYLCLWDWLDPFYTYRVDCYAPVDVDENGYFERTVWYPCTGDQPDIYIKAEQYINGMWKPIYAPSVRCNTHWNYACGSEIVINVTDPAAIPCAPEDPVTPPPGILTWVMPFAVGGTQIWGTPPGNPPAPAGWVRSDGLTDYSGLVNAPFGARLGMRQGYSNNIPGAAGIRFYRWRYRKGGVGAWTTLHDDVGRHYVRQSPGLLPSFPVYPLGPKPAGSLPDAFEFKPFAPPPPAVTDPPGTITYWPTDDTFADIYSAFFNTLEVSPVIGSESDGRPFLDAGVVQVRLEVLDGAGNPVMPGPGTFRFIVPTGVDVDGETVLTREAQPSELDGGAFVFNLHVDNNVCYAEIGTPHIGLTASADDCGFLRYDESNSDPVTLAFEARHHNNHATFSFNVVRGATPVGAASASGEVGALAAAPYTGDGSGAFSEDFARATLLDTCINAAFAEHLGVHAKATNGWGRIDDYDAGDLEAFALAPEEPEE